MTPSTATLREALRSAMLAAAGARFEQSGVAIAIVRLGEPVLPPGTSPAQFWYQDLRLSLQRELMREAGIMNAVLVPYDQHSFLVVTTVGSLRSATDDFTNAPFLSHGGAFGVELNVGIGLGRDAIEADANANRAVARAADARGLLAYLIGRNQLLRELTIREKALDVGATGTHAQAAVRQLIEHLQGEGIDPMITDAEKASEILSVTTRSARRTLHALVQYGLARPMPADRERRVGRPPRRFLLLQD